jgi:hypothetical protein
MVNAYALCSVFSASPWLSNNTETRASCCKLTYFRIWEVTKAPMTQPPIATEDGLLSWKKNPGLKRSRAGAKLHQFTWVPCPSATTYYVIGAAKSGKTLKQLNHKPLVNPKVIIASLPRGNFRIQIIAFDAVGNEIARRNMKILNIP